MQQQKWKSEKKRREKEEIKINGEASKETFWSGQVIESEHSSRLNLRGPFPLDWWYQMDLAPIAHKDLKSQL